MRLVIAVAWLAAAGSALAQAQDSTRAHLSVQGPTCASEAALQAAVRERSARIAFVPAQPGVMLLEAAFTERAPAEWHAELVVRGPRRSERQLLAGSCQEAVDALGLLIAMTLDPALAEAQVTPAPARPPHSAKAPKTAVPAVASAPALEPEPAPQAAPAPETAPAPEAAPAPAAPEPARESPPPAVAPSEEKSQTSQFGAGLTAQLTFGPAPEPMAGLALDVYWALERDSLLAPAVRLRAQHGFGVSVSEPLGRADFALDFAVLELCPLRLPLASAAMRGCAMGTFGRLAASGHETYDPQSSARFFASLGVSLWFVLPIVGGLQLQASAGLGTALIRDEYAFTPQTFHQVSAVHFDLGLGLGLRFL